VVNDVDYTAVDGVGLSCKDRCGVVVPVRKDLVINRVSKSYSVALLITLRKQCNISTKCDL